MGTGKTRDLQAHSCLVSSLCARGAWCLAQSSLWIVSGVCKMPRQRRHPQPSGKASRRAQQAHSLSTGLHGATRLLCGVPDWPPLTLRSFRHPCSAFQPCILPIPIPIPLQRLMLFNSPKDLIHLETDNSLEARGECQKLVDACILCAFEKIK